MKTVINYILAFSWGLLSLWSGMELKYFCPFVLVTVLLFQIYDKITDLKENK